MSTHEHALSKHAADVSLKSVASGLLQPKCACGGAVGMSGECEGCSKKQRLGLQTKLMINKPGDIYEQEADRIADQVLAVPSQDTVRDTPPPIQRLSGHSNGELDAAPASVGQTLASPGRPLEPTLRYDMEQRFGHNFSRVRVHSDAAAEQSARDVSANAYTVGSSIVFGAGRFAPGTTEGRRLIAHELTHVVQQSSTGRSRETLARQPDPNDKPAADPNIELARKLAKKLQEKKRDEVLKDIEGLKPADRDALEVAATQALALDKARADEVRRIIRFVRHKPGMPPKGPPLTVVAAGATEPKAAAKVHSGKVELRTGVSIKAGAGGNSTEAYSLSYSGPDVDDMRWLQFIWREVVSEFPTKSAKPRKESFRKELSHSGRDFRLTTDPARPSWNTDSGTSRSPFYEENTTVERTTTDLTMFDFPSSMKDSAVAEVFKTAAIKPTRVISHFHAATYLIHRMDVLYLADIDLTWEFTAAADSPTAKATAKGGPAQQLDSVLHARLMSQDPDVDYLPGPAPDQLGEFDVVQDLLPKGSLTEKQWADKGTTDLKRYADIVAIANAWWINDVAGNSSRTINAALHKPDAKPGLNYMSNLSTDGETGYIDAAGAYHNPDLPLDRTGSLPRIAIILGPKAFSRDKAWALGTLRHEMRHAAHEQLAIGWLLKWRDAGVTDDFEAWLRAQHKAKRISDGDFALVSTGIKTSTGFDLAATEVGAHTEDIITTLPFLPPQPDLQTIANDNYPAAIRGLKQAQPYFDAGSAAPLRESAFQRIHDSCCAAGNCDALVAWITFLLNPASLKAKSKDEEVTLKLVVSDFKSHEGFLKQVLARARKSCT